MSCDGEPFPDAELTRGMFNALRLFLARLPGGLAISSVGACAFFAAASGSSVATAAAMSRIAIPEMSLFLPSLTYR